MSNANEQLAHVNQLISDGSYHEAITRLQPLETQASTRRPATALKALALAMKGDRDDAFTAVQAFGEPLIDDRAETLLAAGSAAFRIGALPPAIALLRQALQRAPEHPIVNARLGACLLGAGRHEAARPHIERAAQLLKDSGGAWLNLAHIRLLNADAQGALEALKHAEPLPDKEIEIYDALMADALQKLKRPEEALAFLRSRTESGDTQAVVNLIRHLTSLMRHDEAWQLTREQLERQPENVELIEIAAELAQVRGRFGEADHYLAQALSIAPENAALWRRRAMGSSRRHNTNIAREAANKAMALTQSQGGMAHALSLSAHAQVLAEEGHTEAAEKAYQEALQLNAQCAPALRGLGQLLMQIGRVDEATDFYERLKAIAPLQGWSQLIHAREIPDDEEVLARMENAARRPSLEGPVQSNMLFTLAAAWERKGDYEKAWQFVTEANEATKSHLGYRPESHRNRVEREMARFSKVFMESRQGWGVDSHVPVFVLGMPRSGTTLVEQILGSHSQVFGAGELSLVPELIQRLNAWEVKLGSRREYPECVDDMTQEESRRFAQRHLQELQAYAPGAARIVDKLPHNFEHVGLIKLLFPNAKILHLKREPRDVAMSNYFVDYGAKFGGMGFAYDLTWIGEQLVDHQRLIAHWHQVFPGQILDVDYDALVEDVEGWAHRIIDHLGLPWEDGVLQFQSLDRAVKTASVWQVRQPVYTTSKAKWKRYEAHLETLEAALSEVPPPPTPLPLPKLPAGLFLSGMEALKSGDAKQAEQLFRALLAARSAHGAAHHFLGAALLQLDRAQEARQAMRRSLELSPGQLQWLENLLQVEQRLNDNPEGIEKLKTRIAQLRSRVSSR